MYRFTVGDYNWTFANTYNSTLLSFQNQGFYIGNSYYQGYGDGALNVMPIYNSAYSNTCALYVNNPFNDGSASILCRNTNTSSGGVSLVSFVGNNLGLTFASAKTSGSTTNYTFFVTGDGSIYSKGSWLTSDISKKKDIRELESPLDKIMQLHGVEFAFIEDASDNQNAESRTMESESNNKNDSEIHKEQPTSRFSLSTLDKNVLRQMEDEQNEMRNIGFIAQEVEKVLPNVVRTSIDGTKAVSYVQIIALLVEGMKEQQQVIEQLRTDVANLQQEQINKPKKARNISACSQAFLYQNTPNPFSQSTTIGYYLPADTREAAIHVYDMTGGEIAAYPLTSFGNGELTIDGGTFRAGMYLYSLIADGQLIDTKQMILTK